MTHILIVEDDLAFGTMMQTWLKKKGFETSRATSVGTAARLLTDGTKPDLVLSDLRLPDHDGLFLLGWMRKRGHNAPFIVMTNYAEVQNAVLAMKLGAADYIAKPVQPDILLQKIKDALAQAADTPANENFASTTPYYICKRHGTRHEPSRLPAHLRCLHTSAQRARQGGCRTGPVYHPRGGTDARRHQSLHKWANR